MVSDKQAQGGCQPPSLLPLSSCRASSSCGSRGLKRSRGWLHRSPFRLAHICDSRRATGINPRSPDEVAPGDRHVVVAAVPSGVFRAAPRRMSKPRRSRIEAEQHPTGELEIAGVGADMLRRRVDVAKASLQRVAFEQRRAACGFPNELNCLR